MSNYLVAFALFALFFLALPFAQAATTTTFSSYQITGTTDQNILLTCIPDTNGCKTLSWNINNEGWNYESFLIAGKSDPGIAYSADSSPQWYGLVFKPNRELSVSGIQVHASNTSDTCKIFNEARDTLASAARSGRDANFGASIILSADTNYLIACGKDDDSIHAEYANVSTTYPISNTYGSWMAGVNGVNHLGAGGSFSNSISFAITGLYYDGSPSTTVNTVYLGVGDHNIQYYSTDNLDNNEPTNTSYFTTYAFIHINTFDENTNSLLNTNITFNGTTYTDVNSLDLNLQTITAGTYTIQFSKTGYGTRYYIADMNNSYVPDSNIQFMLLPEELGIDVDFKVYQSDETTLYSNTYIKEFNWNKNNRIIGRGKTNASGEITFNINPNDSNYTMRIFGSTTVDYNAMTLTVNKPKSEATGLTIDGNWDLVVGGLAWQSYTNLSGNQTVQIYSNTQDYYSMTVGDDNTDYYDRKYYVNYIGATTAETLQPYLVPVAQAVSTTIHTESAYTQVTVPNVELKIYKVVPIVGRVLVEQVRTDDKGEALVSLIANDEYEFEITYNGESKGTLNITATSVNIWIDIDNLTFTTPTIDISGLPITFYPQRSKLIKADIILTQQVSLNDYNLGVTITNITIWVTNTDINGVYKNDQNIYSTTLAAGTLTNSIDLNYLAQTIDNNFYDTNGSLTVYVYVQTNQGNILRYYKYNPVRSTTSFDFLQVISFDIRPSFGCIATQDPSIPCGLQILAAIFISFIIVIALAMETGFQSAEGLGIIFIMILGIFAYFSWIPIVLYGIMIVGVIGLMLGIGRLRI